MAEPPPFRVFLSPQGRRLDRTLVRELAAQDRLLLLCGRYEGVDERVLEHAIDLEVSVGDFVVSGGELPAMLLLDAVARCVPGVLGSEGSLDEESFDEGLLEYPQYTRPAEFRGWPVPDLLLSGNHAAIDTWRRERRIERTAARRPDLLPYAALTPAERAAALGERGEAERRVGDTLLRVRVAAVLLDADRVLVEAGESGWSLPGGTVLVGEPASEAVRRVLREAMGVKADAGAILGVDEQLSEREPPGGEAAAARCHDIVIFVEVTPPPRLTRRESFRAGAGAHFRWIALNALTEGSIRPPGALALLRQHRDASAGE